MGTIDPRELRVTRHALDRLDERRLTLNDLYATLREPETTYPNPGHPGQVRYVRGVMTVVVDTVRRTVPTVLYNKANDRWKANANPAFA